MSASRSTDDVERLLRRTYAEVTERTTMSPRATSGVVRLSPATAPRLGGRHILVAAAMFALVVGGLFALSNRDAEQPAGRDVATRVVPGWVPSLASADGSIDRALILTELHSNPERDRITYANRDASITVELDRTRRVLGDGEPATVRATPGRRTDSSLSWIGPDDAVVEVSWTGSVDETTIDSFVRAIAYVDDDVWIETVGTGGFRRQPPEPLATVRIDADVPFDVDIVGDLHDGLSLQVGPNGFRSLGTGRCSASVNYETSDLDTNVTGYVILAPGDAASAVVGAIGNDDRRIDLTSLLPLVDVSIGGVVYDERRPSARLPVVDCEEAS